jgi:hypothetical protein
MKYWLKNKKKHTLIQDEIVLALGSTSSTLDDRDSIEYYVDGFKYNKAFKPDDLCDLISLMNKYKIEFSPVLFKVSLRSQFDLSCLINMPEHESKSILPCLSVAQKKRFSERKNQPKKEQETKETTTDKIHISTTSEYSNNIFKTVPSSFETENIRHSSEQPNFNRNSKSENENCEPVCLPDSASCSICGEFKRWVCSNPYKCGECLRKIHNK